VTARVRLLSARQAVLDLLYPERCVGCGVFGCLLCAECRASLRPTTGAGRCPHCSAAWDGEGNCPRCFHWDALDGAAAAADMEGPARRLVHGLKYEGVRGLAREMAAAMQPLREARPFDFAIAIPLHPSRQRRRGFNQAELLLEALEWPRPEATLHRTRKTSTQVGMRLSERRANVVGAFDFRGPELAGATVALVDDVLTTGATANECARVLRDHGAGGVVALAFARASYRPEAQESDVIDD
jgi:ComF family protein